MLECRKSGTFCKTHKELANITYIFCMLMQLPRDRADFMHFIAILKQGTSTNMIVRIWTDLEKILVEGI